MIEKKIHKRGYTYYAQAEQLKKSRKEDSELIEFVAWFKYNYPDYVIWHTVNEIGVKSVQYHENAKRKGKLNGVSDILIFANGKLIAIEIKRASVRQSTKVTDEQIEFISNIEKNGGYGGVAYGCLSAKEIVREYLT